MTATAPALATGADASTYRPADVSGEAFIFDMSLWASLYGLIQRGSLRTGQDTMPAPRPTPVRNWFPLVDLPAKPTGYGWISAPVLHAYVAEGDPQDLDETETRSATLSLVCDSSLERAVPESPEASAAVRLGALTGLEKERLAALLGVSRTTLYAWLDGSRPRGGKRDHLLHVVAVMEDVARRFAGPREVAAWLLTPSAASGRTPFDVLKERRYDLCRAMLARRRAARPALPKRAPRAATGAALRQAFDRLSSAPSVEDYEEGEEQDD
jgi:hypothetical protein